MDSEQVQGIANYRWVSETVGSSGQPSEAELEAVARSGYQVVINLGLLGEPYSLPDERGVVAALGLEYVHIPVVWEQPTQDDLEQFFAAMDAHEGKKVFVHCAANMRVSAFLALYRVVRLGWPVEQAFREVRSMQFPEVWLEFMDAMLVRYTGSTGKVRQR
jgi:uncharacterized protein (TIGR01244 family)